MRKAANRGGSSSENGANMDEGNNNINNSNNDDDEATEIELTPLSPVQEGQKEEETLWQSRFDDFFEQRQQER